MSYLDGIILMLLGLGAFRGYRKGLLNSLTGLVGLALGCAVASSWARPVAFYLDKRYLITSRITPWLAAKLPDLGLLERPDKGGFFAGFFHQLLNKLPLGSPAVSEGNLIYNLSFALLVAVVFLLLIFIATFLLRLLATAITATIKHTLLGGINRLGGLIVGLVTTAFILGLLLVVVTPLLAISTAVPGGGILADINGAINRSVLVPKLMFLFKFIIQQYLFFS
ncbi:MAG: CvpA family protein [Thermoanaerobacteraceae bacterium]|nr:CvpA family protein [Thermoanaerobacteraceae bacterium]